VFLRGKPRIQWLGATMHHGPQIVVSDVDAARAELAERGVEVSTLH